MLKVFISSTSEDLKEHRQAIANALRKASFEIIWMEEFVAEGEARTWNILERKIE
jgi:hypothetical protein